MNFLYVQKERDITRWGKKIKANIRKIKINPTDENEVDFIDVDVLIKLYMEEYFDLRRQIQKEMRYEFAKFKSNSDE